MSDVLLDLVRCETYRAQFPAGLPWRGCLRRQLEAKREGKGWEPARPFCASTCELGREVAAAARSAGVALGTCSGCGAALVGVESCEPCLATGRALRGPKVLGEPCAGCGNVSSHKAGCPRPPRLRTRARRARRAAAAPVKLLGAPVSTRIWGPDAPDAPIAPPPRQDVGLTAEQVAEATERVRAATGQPTRVATPPRPPPSYRIDPAPAASFEVEKEATPPACETSAEYSSKYSEPKREPSPAVAQHQPPAQPAQETTMEPRKPTRKPKECCGSKGPRCLAGCKGKPAPAAPAKKAAPARAKKAAKPIEVELAAYSVVPVAQFADEDLAKSIAECRAELARRIEAARERTKRLEEIERSIGEAA